MLSNFLSGSFRCSCVANEMQSPHRVCSIRVGSFTKRNVFHLAFVEVPSIATGAMIWQKVFERL